MVSIELFRYNAEPKCPHCASSNIDTKYRHMGEYNCRHCHHYWRVE